MWSGSTPGPGTQVTGGERILIRNRSTNRTGSHQSVYDAVRLGKFLPGGQRATLDKPKFVRCAEDHRIDNAHAAQAHSNGVEELVVVPKRYLDVRLLDETS